MLGLLARQTTMLGLLAAVLCGSSWAFVAPTRGLRPASLPLHADAAMNFGEMFSKVLKGFDSGGGASSKSSGGSVGTLLQELLGGDGGVDPAAVAAACAEDVVYEDMASSTYEGPAAVAAYFTTKYPSGTRLKVERTAGNATTGGVTWRRQSVGDDSVYGLRGTTYCRLNGAGKIAYVREGSEPILKPGEATEALLKAVTANAEKVEKEATYVPRAAKGAVDVVEYLWNEAYPKGAKPDVALELFAEDIEYQDFNYPAPFLGKPAVKDFVEAFDIPGIDFVPLEISGGDGACCFTWIVRINGQDGPKGISFYESDASGKISFIRDIPGTTPAPLQNLAALVNPTLRVFTPRKS